LHDLEVLSDRLTKSGRRLLLCGARHQPAKMLKRADFIEHIGEHNILPHAQAALERAREIQAGFMGLGDDVADDPSQAPR
jgi:SulP family sulfate permease